MRFVCCAIVVSVLLSGCVMTKPRSYDSLAPGIRLSSFSREPLYVSFRLENNEDYTHIVQEITVWSGEKKTTLVEAFRVSKGGYCLDNHAWSAPQRRRFVLYAANVVGADEEGGLFCHLPSNMDGSVKTNVPLTFNESYQNNYETRGKIVAASKHKTFWSTEVRRNASGGFEIDIELPDRFVTISEEKR